jgi:hypothetical protein
MGFDKDAIKEERVDLSGINWKQFSNEDEIQFEDSKEKKLTLANWSQTSLYGEPAIRFDVIKEDGKAVKKTLTTKSKRLIRQLKPLMIEAFCQVKNELYVSITRTGTGYDTQYRVKEMT